MILANQILRNFTSRTPCLYKASCASTAAGQKKKIPLITCKNKKLDLYEGDKINKSEEEIVLASKGWQHYKSKGDFFTIHPTRDASNTLIDAPEFNTLGLNEQLVKNLDVKHDIIKATKLQINTMRQIFDNQHVLLAAETGCGKTHAYLVPIIEKILAERENYEDRKFNSPLVLILTPARELAEQIGRMATDLVDGLNLNVKVTVGGKTKQKMLHPSFEDIDILVGSIGAISKLTTSGIFRMDHVKFVVLDESDTLLDESFNEKMSYFLKRFKFYKNTQLILVSATMPTSIDDVFRTIIDTDTLKHVVSEDLHKILPFVTQKFLRMNKSGRPEHLLRIVKADLDKKRPIIIFSNKTPTSDYINIFLNNNGIDSINVNGDMSNNLRAGRFDQFQRGEVNVLSTTDCLGRGINTIRARHIINFDFPMFVADYIHRCGRIGRLGGVENGIITNFISSLAEVDLVRKVEMSARTNYELYNVDANIGKIYRQRVEKEIEKHERNILQQQNSAAV